MPSCPQCPPKEPPSEDVHYKAGFQYMTPCCKKPIGELPPGDTFTDDPLKANCGYWGALHVFLDISPGVGKWYYNDLDGKRVGPFLTQTEAHKAYDCYKTLRLRHDNARDPIHYVNGKWYFWDEVWVDTLGPFETWTEAMEALDKYCKEVLDLKQGHEKKET